MGLFDSPRQDAAQGLYGQQLSSYNDLLNGLPGLQSQFSGVKNLSDLYGKFGLQPFDLGKYQNQVEQSFAPGKAGLATALAQNRGAIASREGGGSASPEAMFAPVEGNYAQALGGLEGQEGNQLTAGFDKQRQSQQFNADFLSNVLGNQDAYSKWKLGARTNLLGEKGGAIKDYLGSQSGSSLFNDIIGGVGTAGSLAFAGGWKPFGGGSSSPNLI